MTADLATFIFVLPAAALVNLAIDVLIKGA